MCHYQGEVTLLVESTLVMFTDNKALYAWQVNINKVDSASNVTSP